VEIIMNRLVHAAAGLAIVFAATPASAQDTVVMGSVGSSSANSWATYVAIEKGYFAAAGIKPDVVHAQSNAGVIQQLAAGSINISNNSGLVDPIRAAEKGAPVAILRVEIQRPPYSVLAKPAIKTVNDIKGKLVSVGGAKDITRIYVERMFEAKGVKPGEFDMAYAGATSARFAALQSGAVDAAILTPPFNFAAESAGFINLGNVNEYVDMPFAGIAVNTRWAETNKAVLGRIVGVYNQSIAWLYDPKNRAEAVQILNKVSRLKIEDAEKAYDFLIGGRFFEPSGKVSKALVGKLVEALISVGDLPKDFSVDRLFMPGVTQVSN
jgi:ABC-type nitrate/sulfonate/bicarbonate transport system substrate-binding protein